MWFVHEKEWGTDIYYSIDEPWNIILKRKKDTKAAYYMIYIWNVQNM